MHLLRSAPQCLTLVDIPAQTHLLWLLKFINEYKMVGWLVTTTVSQFLCYHGNHYVYIYTCVQSAICF